MSLRKVYGIDQGWLFKQDDDPSSEFLPVSRFPTNVHLDLLHHKLIPDPNVGNYEEHVQWIGEKSWVYRTELICSKPVKGKAILAFDGLDTYSTVRLNGDVILKTENMFIPERVNVTGFLSADGPNILEITFDSTYLIGKKIVKKYPSHYWGCWNGDPSRLAVRKAQYHYVIHTVSSKIRQGVTDPFRVGIGALLCSLAALGDPSHWKFTMLVSRIFRLLLMCIGH